MTFLSFDLTHVKQKMRKLRNTSERASKRNRRTCCCEAAVFLGSFPPRNPHDSSTGESLYSACWPQSQGQCLGTSPALPGLMRASSFLLKRPGKATGAFQTPYSDKLLG